MDFLKAEFQKSIQDSVFFILKVPIKVLAMSPIFFSNPYITFMILRKHVSITNEKYLIVNTNINISK